MLVAPSLRYGIATAEDIAGMTGLQVMQALIDGKLPAPPIAQTLSFWLVEVGDGVAVFEGETGPHVLNPLGIVHGGWALTLIDSATGCAGHTLLPPGVGYTSVETKANFTRPIKQDTGRVRAEGRVVNRGRQIMTAEAHIFDSDGRLLAHGTSTLMVLGGAEGVTEYVMAPPVREDSEAVKPLAPCGSSAFTRRPPKTTACACWSTDCGRAALPKTRRTSTNGSRTSRQATRCAGAFTAIRRCGRSLSPRMAANSRKSRQRPRSRTCEPWLANSKSRSFMPRGTKTTTMPPH